MLRLVIACWLAALAIGESQLDTTSPTNYGCQLLPVLRKLRSRLYSHEGCTLTVPTYVCAGFCETSVDPVRVKKSKEYSDVYQVQFKQDCRCCIPKPRDMNTATVEVWKLKCPKNLQRNESVTLQWPSACSCTRCRSSSKVGK